jgi:tetratricopeptide (TPR) repeat protein
MHFCQSGLSLAISIGNTLRQSLALQQSAWIRRDMGDLPGAQEDASESQRLARTTGNLFREASALRVEAVCWTGFGSYSHSLSLLDRAAHLLVLCGMSGGELHSTIRSSQAEVHCRKSEYMEARKIQTHILHNSSADQVSYYHAFALFNVAQIDVEIGGPEHSVLQKLDTASQLFKAIPHSLGHAWCDLIRADLHGQQGNLSEARSLFQKYLRSTWGKDTEAMAYCLEKLVTVQQWHPVFQSSFLWTVTFLVHSLKCKLKLELHKALQFLGDVFQVQGDQDTAISLFTVALSGFTKMDVHRSRAECMVRLGDISKLNGDELKTAALWEAARPLFERSSQGKQLIKLNSKLAGLGHNQLQYI